MSFYFRNTAMFGFNLLLLFAQLTSGLAGSAGTSEVPLTYKLTGAPKSKLFSKCFASAWSVEGTLFNIEVSQNEEFVRFAPKEKKEMSWLRVILGGNGDIIDCAHTAQVLGANMFRYDDSCYVVVGDAYDPYSQQDHSDAPEEVVYITNRPLVFINGALSSQVSDCSQSSSKGVTFGDDDNRLVAAAQLPSPATCCSVLEESKCLFVDCAPRDVSYCEAKARCEARGFSLMSKELVDNVQMVEAFLQLHAANGMSNAYFWVDVTRGEDRKWWWGSDGSELSGVEIQPDTSDSDCMKVYQGDLVNGVLSLYSAPCTQNQDSCALCFHPDSSLNFCTSS